MWRVAALHIETVHSPLEQRPSGSAPEPLGISQGKDRDKVATVEDGCG
jgi:hypothetical protein